MQIIENDTYNIVASADVSITASGTATLEVALLETPMSIIYIGSPISAWIARRVIRLEHIGLCNIILEKTAVRELLQEDATPQAICQETLRLLNDKTYRNQLISELQKVRPLLGEQNGSEKAAACALNLISTDKAAF